MCLLEWNCIFPYPVEIGKNNKVGKTAYTKGVSLNIYFLASLEMQ